MPHSSGASCETCPAWARVPPPIGPDEGKGDCRVRRPDRLAYRAGGSDFTPAWARTDAGQFCMEHPALRHLMRESNNAG